MLENLKRAVVTETNEVILNDVVYERALKVWPSIAKIFNLVPSKYLIVFESNEEVEEGLRENSSLWEMFQVMRKWNELEDISQRMVWIEFIGILPKLLSHQNIRKLDEIWGKVLCLDVSKQRNESICQVEMLVRTSNMSLINHRILVQTNMEGFEVWVKETMPNTQLIKYNPWLHFDLEETDEDDNSQPECSQVEKEGRGVKLVEDNLVESKVELVREENDVLGKES